MELKAENKTPGSLKIPLDSEEKIPFENPYRSVDMKLWTTEDVADWLKDIGFSNFAASFKNNMINGVLLVTLHEEDFRDLGVTNKFHLKNLLLQRTTQQREFIQKNEAKKPGEEMKQKIEEAKGKIEEEKGKQGIEEDEKEKKEVKRVANDKMQTKEEEAKKRIEAEEKTKEEAKQADDEMKKKQVEEKKKIEEQKTEAKNHPIEFKYMFEWKGPKGKEHKLFNVIHDNHYLYINCALQGDIYRYSFDGELVNTLKYNVRAMETVNNQLYLLDSSKFFIVDIKTNSKIESWDLPKEKGGPVGGYYLKVDQENIYWTPWQYSHHVYLYSKTGKEIKKFGSKEMSEKEGEFYFPNGLTVDEKYLYVCDYWNKRVQVLDKENGTFIHQWKQGQRLFSRPQSILLYEHLLYVGDADGIQVFTKQSPYKCIQVFGKGGSGKGEFKFARDLCIVNDKLFIVDTNNQRVQVWS